MGERVLSLEKLGWCSDWDELLSPPLIPARITERHKVSYGVTTAAGTLHCRLSGKFQFGLCSKAEFPAIGDWVLITPPFREESGKLGAIIETLLPRQSRLSRTSTRGEEQVLAANVNFTFIVTSPNEDFSTNRMERYLLLATEGNTEPVIVLAKLDLDPEHSALNTLKSHFPDRDVIGTSVIDGIGVDDIRKKLTLGTTGVFVGSSGVGKSSLVNYLLGEETQKVHTVRDQDSKGRHTTTGGRLFPLRDGGMIIDTPGLREVNVFGSDPSVEETFSRLAELAENCRFSNCRHLGEKGCAVRPAIESGELTEAELENYHKLKKEAEFSQRKMDKRLASNTKKRWKTITKDYKRMKKQDD